MIAEAILALGMGAGLPGFDCVSTAAAARCVGRVEGYPRPVAVVIPVGYERTGGARIVLHLHGFNLSPERPLEAFLSGADDRLEAGFVESGRRAILVVPHSRGRCDDFNASLAGPAAFRRFTANVASLLRSAGLTERPGIETLTLTGHSGAYEPIAAILEGGVHATAIREVYLLDSRYLRAETFDAWVRADAGRRFWSAFIPGGGGTARGHARLLALLAKGPSPVPYVLSSSSIPTLTELASRVGFIHSDRGHSATVGKYFPILLGAAP
jgi:hypothetical protein